MSPLSLTRAELAGWLRLAGASGVPASAWAALLNAFASLEALFGASHTELAALIGDAAARAVLAPSADDFERRVDETLAWLDAPGNALVTRHDSAYPGALAELYDPPPLLYIKGRVALLHAQAVAIVGSRGATPQGLADATRFARELSDSGLAIVSGLARGIDGAAHRGGLDGASSTVAVIGTGADLVYPACHHALAHEIAERGALVSEWPLRTPARAAHFPQRNRLIAALSGGVLIVEAAPRSGSLITARLANDMGRDVFAIPGSIHAPLSQGCHALIRDGAKLVETAADVLDEFGLDRARPAAASRNAPADASTDAGLDADARRLLDAIGHGPVPLELLAQRTSLASDALHRLLLQLELAGRITALPGGRYTRIDGAQGPAQAHGTGAVLHSGE
ncbi:DNA-processing protein DprA [Burkholderia oklahomensis]|uniref:DNA-processing protein DprA n=1 Tax=Burkholderia oklahomensis TaxID=342113 RepID=UPI00016A9059|nr:DNA-processing protein DprA [Burkholderia oklahomensis]AJX31431.1 DNA protecting protein DprA [Burkholderia oklahomensis C6786]AOI47544.1 DNA processing protein DprA [Burkholderia oklahomensis C6786]KUY61689.1 DNA processing protein DprA [Burkholderia oklahomensis C6786]MBI0359731.1 DNA-protecting protein DprA [Burkholderia oklahomensis]SUW59118.1 DNA protecting protein DprA [Burkholderia oklahomensis]